MGHPMDSAIESGLQKSVKKQKSTTKLKQILNKAEAFKHDMSSGAEAT